MARQQKGTWDQLNRINTLLGIGFSVPVVTGVSYVFGVLGQRVPLFSAFCTFGIAFCFLVCFLVLSLCAALRAYAKKKGRATSEGTPDKFTEIILWKWWPWIILAACIIFSSPFIETRPRLPEGISPELLNLPIASYKEMRGSTIIGKTVVINEVPRSTKEPMIIRNKSFEHCKIVGPAVLAIAPDIELHQCRFGIEPNEPESILLETKSKWVTLGCWYQQTANFKNVIFWILALLARKSVSMFYEIREWANKPQKRGQSRITAY